MKIRFIGTGAGLPSKERNVSSLVLELLNELGEEWMVDCGEGTQRQLLETNVRPAKLGKIFITHLHGDHIYGLPGILSSISHMGRTEPIEIYGPKGLKDWVMSSLKVCNTRLAYHLKFIEVSDGAQYDLGLFTVDVMKLKHDVECFGFKFIQKDLLGILNVDKAKQLGVPFGPLLGKLKNGEDVTLDNGLTVKSSEVMGEKRKGKTFVVLGDTSYYKEIAKFVNGADILVHESTFYEGLNEGKPKYGHSSNVDAATIAKEGKVKQLYLNHISSRYLPYELNNMESESKNIFKETKVVNDFDEYDI